MSSNELATLQNLVDEEAINIARFLLGRCLAARTSLVDAVRAGRADLLATLLECGADANAAEADRGCTPLTQALLLRDRACAELLIKHGADVNLTDGNGKSPLTVAVEDVDLLRLLLEEGASGVQDAFLAAIARENLDAVELLAARGADANAGSPPPLIRALDTGDPRMVRLLIDAGADVNMAADGDTPLTRAIKRRDADGGKTSRTQDLSFLIYYFDLDKDYFDAFEARESREGVDELVRLLVDNGADVNRRDGLRRSPFSLAVSKRNLGLVKYLQQRGAIVDCVEEIREIAKEDEAWRAHFEKLLN